MTRFGNLLDHREILVEHKSVDRIMLTSAVHNLSIAVRAAGRIFRAKMLQLVLLLFTLFALGPVKVSCEEESKQSYTWGLAIAPSYPWAGGAIFNPLINPLQRYPRPYYPSYPLFIGNTGGYYRPNYGYHHHHHHHRHRNWGR